VLRDGEDLLIVQAVKRDAVDEADHGPDAA
jgi:hypothetical protein